MDIGHSFTRSARNGQFSIVNIFLIYISKCKWTSVLHDIRLSKVDFELTTPPTRVSLTITPFDHQYLYNRSFNNSKLETCTLYNHFIMYKIIKIYGALTLLTKMLNHLKIVIKQQMIKIKLSYYLYKLNYYYIYIN